MKKLLLLLMTVHSLQAKRVDIVSNFDINMSCPATLISQETGFELQAVQMDFVKYLDSKYTPDVDKVLVMNPIIPGNTLTKLHKINKKRRKLAIHSHLPNEKLVLFLWEADGAPFNYCHQFHRVYTFNDDLVDNIKFFKFYYPDLTPMLPTLPAFEDRKLCVMITSHSTPARIKILSFFEKKPKEELDYYGFRPIANTPLYKGAIPGYHGSQAKLNLMANYRFAICFENSYVNGYVTEKIFTCLASGCVPIYYGAPNIETYIPKECFIDYRDFKNDEELYTFLLTMDRGTHESYLDNIRKFLESDQAQLFSKKNFCTILKEAMSS